VARGLHPAWWPRQGDAPDGDLWWPRHDGRTDSWDRWTGPKRLGRQWPQFHAVCKPERFFEGPHDVAEIADREEVGRCGGHVVALNRQVEPSTRQACAIKRSTTCAGQATQGWLLV
jgi:hypothetical protein